MEFSWLIAAGLTVGFYVAWNIGANDLANAMGTVFGSGALNLKQIIVLGSFLNVAGAVFFGSRVVETIGHGIVKQITPLGALSGLLAAGVFITFACFFKMPVSTTHSIVGAVLGYGLLKVGFNGIEWLVVLKIAMAWVLSPLVGICMGFLVYRFIRNVALENVEDITKAEQQYHLFHVASSSYQSFAHGSNDVANATALLTVLLVGGLESGETLSVPAWVLLFGGIGIAFGLATFGRGVMQTVGLEITRMNYPRGYSAEFSAASVVLICSYLGLPISTTHTSVGTIAGVGLARGRSAVDFKILAKIFVSWSLTLPLAGFLSVVFFKLLQILSGL